MKNETELDRINKFRLYRGLPKLKEIVIEDTKIDGLEKQRKAERHEMWLAKKERNETWSIDKQQKKWINDYYTPNMDTVFYSGLSCEYGKYSGYNGTKITDNSIYFLDKWRMIHWRYNDNKKIHDDIESLKKYLED